MNIKKKPEDFVVFEEMNLTREGESYNIYLMMKKNLSTIEAIKRVARENKTDIKELFYGGYKDKRSISFQYVGSRKELKSPGNPKLFFLFKSDERPSLEKLVGNRFSVKVEKKPLLKDNTFPNYFGNQRFQNIDLKRKISILLFKKDWENALREILSTVSGYESERSKDIKNLFSSLWGDWEELEKRLNKMNAPQSKIKTIEIIKKKGFKEALRRMRKKLLVFNIKAYQSYLFNKLLSKIIKYKELDDFYLLIGNQELAFFEEKPYKKIPKYLPYFSKNAKFKNVRELAKEVLEEDGLRQKDLDLKDISVFLSEGKRKSIESAKCFYFLEEKERVIFSLNKGAYATIFLSKNYKEVVE